MSCPAPLTVLHPAKNTTAAQAIKTNRFMTLFLFELGIRLKTYCEAALLMALPPELMSCPAPFTVLQSAKTITAAHTSKVNFFISIPYRGFKMLTNSINKMHLVKVSTCRKMTGN